jgi:hypothetical protein
MLFQRLGWTWAHGGLAHSGSAYGGLAHSRFDGGFGGEVDVELP